jgi:hypothetical protein
MNVVERGTARCPRCMALTDYCFGETSGGILRYEVSCQPCGHVYVELSGPAATEFTAA